MKSWDKVYVVIIFGCLDEGVDEDDDGLVGDLEFFFIFFLFSGGEFGLFLILGELVFYKIIKVIFRLYL